MEGYKIKLLKAQAELMKMYLAGDCGRPWYVAYSGGKDSSCVLKLVTDMLTVLPEESRLRQIIVGMSDTIVENPELDQYMRGQVDLVNEWAIKNKMPLTAKIVSRPVEDSYFYLVLGKGYRLPDQTGRWCTDRLKIKPQERLKNEVNPILILTGVRKSESTQRKQSIEKFELKDDLINMSIDDQQDGVYKFAQDGNAPIELRQIYMPIVDFSVEDVWQSLTLGVVWGSTAPVRKLYKDATGECGFTNPNGVEKKAVEVCGARFGCWLCPVISEDKSTERMSRIYKWMEPLTEWRELHMKVYGTYRLPTEKISIIPKKPKINEFMRDGKPDKQAYKEILEAWNITRNIIRKGRADRSAALREVEENNRVARNVTKSGYNRRGQKMEDWQGCLSIEARKYLLDRLLDSQNLMNKIRLAEKLEPLQLISKEEIELINLQHEEDLRERPYLSKQFIDLWSI